MRENVLLVLVFVSVANQKKDASVVNEGSNCGKGKTRVRGGNLVSKVTGRFRHFYKNDLFHVNFNQYFTTIFNCCLLFFENGFFIVTYKNHKILYTKPTLYKTVAYCDL